MTNPFHAGEIEIQELTGERVVAERHGRLIMNAIMPNAQSFLTSRRYCALGWAGRDGDVWASFMTGRDGFVSSNETGSVVQFEYDSVVDTWRKIPPFSELDVDDYLGVLFIDLSTRRRLRVNGAVVGLSENRLTLAVAEVFPNCAKYIQRRQLSVKEGTVSTQETEEGYGLTDEISAWISTADTFFIASAYPRGGVDVSHRGGTPGFVRVEKGGMRIPDYPGNSMFGTLGNLAVNPRAGLVFIDFEHNRQLQLTGDVALDLHARDDVKDTEGTGRWWAFAPRHWVISPLDRAFHWTQVDASAHNL